MSDPEKEAAKADPVIQRKVAIVRGMYDPMKVRFNDSKNPFFEWIWSVYTQQKETGISTFKGFLNDKIGFDRYETEKYTEAEEAEEAGQDVPPVDSSNLEEEWDKMTQQQKAKYMPKSGGKTRRRKAKTSRRRQTRSRRLRK